IRRGKLYVVHVGDSAILLTTRSDRATLDRLTVDYKPESPDERERIEDAGGYVMKSEKSSTYRVVWIRPSLDHVGPFTMDTTPILFSPHLSLACRGRSATSGRAPSLRGSSRFLPSPMSPSPSSLPITTRSC
ncbi:hypothetical protein PENTCL1PPCAC_10354, partial [Pristionchus entomophagus]